MQPSPVEQALAADVATALATLRWMSSAFTAALAAAQPFEEEEMASAMAVATASAVADAVALASAQPAPFPASRKRVGRQLGEHYTMERGH